MRSGGPAGTAIQLERLREPLVQELSELGCRLKLGNRFEFLERRREGKSPRTRRPFSLSTSNWARLARTVVGAVETSTNSGRQP
jgi:hypothetical protein